MKVAIIHNEDLSGVINRFGIQNKEQYNPATVKRGLPTPEFRVFSSPDEDMAEVKFPVIVKPKMEAVSFGLRMDQEKNIYILEINSMTSL